MYLAGCNLMKLDRSSRKMPDILQILNRPVFSQQILIKIKIKNLMKIHPVRTERHSTQLHQQHWQKQQLISQHCKCTGKWNPFTKSKILYLQPNMYYNAKESHEIHYKQDEQCMHDIASWCTHVMCIPLWPILIPDIISLQMSTFMAI